MTARKPNFLIVMTDQQRADHLGCYGNTILQTPHLDGLAAKGLRFERFYVASPSCQPNRASLMTGRMPTVHGGRHNGVPLSRDAVTFADLLRAGGYRTGLIGKCHLQNVTDAPPGQRHTPDGLAPPPPALREARRAELSGPFYETEIAARWRENPTREVSLPYYGFDHIRLCMAHGDMVQGHYTAWLAARHANPDSLRGPKNALPSPDYSVPQGWRTRVPEELYPTRYVEEESAAFLSERSADGAPFLLVASFPDPHHPFTPPGKYWDMYDPTAIPVPASFDDRASDRTDLPQSVLAAYAKGRAEPQMYWPTPVTSRQAQEAIALTYGMISMVDDSIGRLLALLEEKGLAENTIVIFTSDHGDYMGDHGVILKMGLHSHGVLRVPMIWYDPANPGNGMVRPDLGSTLDIARSILARAELSSYGGMQGRDLFGDTAPDGLLIEDFDLRVFADPDEPACMLSFVNDRYRMSLFEGSSFGELYDLRDDPQERVNLWTEPQAAAIRAELQFAMLQATMALRDRSPAPTARA